MKCSCEGCPFPATHKQLNLPDSAALGHVPGSLNYYCDQHTPIFRDLYNAAELMRAEVGDRHVITRPFGPVIKMQLKERKDT